MKLDRQCACVVFVCYVCVLCVVFVCCVCVLCVLCVVFVCLCVVCLCVVCLCLCHVLSFTYVFADHLLVSFTYHLPVGLSLSEVARVRAHFKIFFEWLSKGSLQKYMNDPCFSFGCVVRLPLFFFRWSDIFGVEVIFRPDRGPRVCTHGGTRCQSSLSVSLALTEYSWLGYCILLRICIRRSARHKA